MISDADVERIKKWSQQIKQPLSIQLQTGTDERGGSFTGYFRAFGKMCPELPLIEKQDDTADTPYIKIGNTIIYRAVPSGKDLPVFLDILSGSLTGQIPVKLQRPEIVVLHLYITPHCPYCPQMLRIAAAIALANDQVRLFVTDGARFPEMAEQDSVKSAPVLIYEDFRWTGVVAMADIMEVLDQVPPDALSPSALKHILEEGGAERVAVMMRETRQVFKSLFVLLADEKWSVRLGAMVALEYLADADAEIARKSVPYLWEVLAKDHDNNVRGDLIHMIGITGGSYDIDKLTRLQKKGLPDELDEAICDARIAIRERLQSCFR